MTLEEMRKVGFYYSAADIDTRLAAVEAGEAGGVAWDDVTDKPAVIAAGATAADARTVIGAGTSDLALGTTGTTALAGNGVAASATVLATGRTISTTGGATGTSAAFNGSAAVSIPLVLATPTGALRGGVLQQTAQADSAAAPTQAEFNALLAKLRSAGILAP